MHIALNSRTVAAVISSAILLTACARTDESAPGDFGANTAASAGDTGMAGMDHAKLPGMNRGPAKDADHEFLRMMSDHHEGLVVMMDGAIERATSASARADAKRLHMKQDAERDSIVAIIRTVYSDTITPMVTPSAKATNDSLEQTTGAAYNRELYRRVIMHHQEGIKMIDDFLPRLTRANVRQMAQEMRAAQQREIQEFQPKQTG